MSATHVRGAAAVLLAAGLFGLALLAGPAPEAAAAPKLDPELAAKIKDLIKQLGSDSFDTRQKASEELKKIGAPAVAELRKAAKNEDPEVRHRAQAVLDTITLSVDYLVDGLKDDDAAVRKESAEKLGELGDKAKSAIPALEEALKDKDEEVRDAVIVAIVTIDPDNKKVANAAPKKASVNGKYKKLLRRIKVEQDKASYTEFSDYGYYTGTSYVGFTDLPPGYWVYVYPHWYIWGEMNNK
jgi:HEAT repeat protein